MNIRPASSVGQTALQTLSALPYFLMAAFIVAPVAVSTPGKDSVMAIFFWFLILLGSYFAARDTIRVLPVSISDGKILLMNKWILSSSPPDAVIVKFYHGCTYHTFVRAGSDRIFIAEHHLGRDDKEEILRLADLLGVPVLEQGILAKPKRVRWRRKPKETQTDHGIE